MGDPIGGAFVIACWRPMNTHSRARTDDPAVAFENVSLPFDGNVVLREISFVVHDGQMKRPRDLEKVTAVRVTHQLRDPFCVNPPSRTRNAEPTFRAPGSCDGRSPSAASHAAVFTAVVSAPPPIAIF
jgi:hypothetical protein